VICQESVTGLLSEHIWSRITNYNFAEKPLGNTLFLIEE
jgi:hypothetical protein